MSEASTPLLSPTIGAKVSLSSPTVPTIESLTNQQMPADTNFTSSANVTQPDQVRARRAQTINPSNVSGKNENGENKTDNALRTSRSLKLISVSFKEAALDSPTFRAHVNYSIIQVESIQKWTNSLLNMLEARRSTFAHYKDINNQTHELFESLFLAEGLIDSDYTSAALNFTAVGAKDIQTEFLKFVGPSPEVEALIRYSIRDEITHFFEMRRNFEMVQQRYDVVLNRYNSIPKTRDPQSTREDAIQLSEIRKQYIIVSLDMAAAITDIFESLNHYLVKLMTTLWRSNLDLKLQTKNANSFRKSIERINEFQDISRKTNEVLRSDMISAKNMTVEATIKQVIPSKDLNEYNSAAINPSTILTNYTTSYPEKHGWLYMKTTVGTPPKPTWVRRWCFVKDGMFGMMCLSPSLTSVQELNKMSVALCNVRYSPEEDRRLCFQVKSVYYTIVLQTESLSELKNWLCIFESERAKIISTTDDFGLNKYPPVFKEFACSVTTSQDTKLTSIEESPELKNVISSSHSAFQDRVMASAAFNAPINTALTRPAILAQTLITPATIPTAMTANVWGSVNWCEYYLLDLSNSSGPQASSSRSQTPPLVNQQHEVLSEKEISARYPPLYPSRLLAFDSQLRSLVGPALPNDEFVLMAFKGIWLPNNKQELMGRCYATQKTLYFYINNLGFISIMKNPFTELISFEYTSYDNYDLLKVYEISGLSLKAKLFLDSGKLIKDQLALILKNNLSDEPKSNAVLLKEIETLRSIHAKQEIERLKANYETKKEIIPSVISTSMKLEQPIEIKINYNQEMKLIWDKVYDMPSKALFHCLLGDESFILQKILPYIDARNENISMTLWSANEKQQLSRSFVTDTVVDSYDFRTTRVFQKIESLINSKYYNILQRTQFFKFTGFKAYRVVTRIVIYSLNLRNSKMLIYAKAEFDDENSSPFALYFPFSKFFTTHFIYKATRFKTENLDKDIKHAAERIGGNAKVVKAIRLYGQITKEEKTTEVVPNDDVMTISSIQCIKFMSRRVLFAIGQLILFFIGILIKFLKSIKLNYILTLLLGLSVGYNLLLTGKTTVSFWTASKADAMINDYKSSSNNVMARAIHLKDVQELIESAADNVSNFTNSQCFINYQQNSFLLNPQAEVENDLQKSYREVGLKRNQLLANLRMLNSLEAYYFDAEWNNFIRHELSKCDLIHTLDLHDQDISVLLDYCKSCQDDFITLKSNSLSDFLQSSLL